MSADTSVRPTYALLKPREQQTSRQKEEFMPELRTGDRCKDCNKCKVWSHDSSKATCQLHSDQPDPFHPDRSIPEKCKGQGTRNH